MTTYNTYTEAKIANPTHNIYQLPNNGGFIVFKTNAEIIMGTHSKSVVTLCNPADHCMSLKDFFEAGHKLVDGDCYLFNGEVIIVGDKISAGRMNQGRGFDDLRFVLSAKALNDQAIEDFYDPEFEQVEWKNGDECVFMANPEGEGPQCDAVFIAYHPHHPAVVIDDSQSIFATSLDNIRKKETPEQKKEREEKERARNKIIHDIHTDIAENVEVKDGSIDDYRHELAVYLCDSGYRKPE